MAVRKGDLCAVCFRETYVQVGRMKPTPKEYVGLRIVSKTVRAKFTTDGETEVIPQISHVVDHSTWKRRKEGHGIIVNSATDIEKSHSIQQVYILPDWIQDKKDKLIEFATWEHQFDDIKKFKSFIWNHCPKPVPGLGRN